MIPAAHPGSLGAQRRPPTMTSDPLGSFTTAERNSSCWSRNRFSLPESGPEPRSGPPSITTLVGSPPVWESMTRTFLAVFGILNQRRFCDAVGEYAAFYGAKDHIVKTVALDGVDI